MWRILVFLTGGLGLFLVLILIIFIGISVSSWQAWAIGGACGLVAFLIAKEYEKGADDRNRKWLEKYERKEAQRQQKIQKNEENRQKVGIIK